MRSVFHCLVLLGPLVLACHEYNLGGPKGDPPALVDTDRPFDFDLPEHGVVVDTQDTQPPPGEEECNGVDDDGDGLVDEDFEDHDGDGVADCIDDDCDVDEHEPTEVEVLEACQDDPPPVVSDPWNVGIEWQYTTSSDGVLVMPAVGNLTDDNGDGLIDEHDTPDIAFTEYPSGELVVLHGDGSGTVFVKGDMDSVSGVAIADVDLDGEPEVLVQTVAQTVVALDGEGNTKWVSGYLGLSDYPQPAVADLDGDGAIEVVFDTAVLDGATGATLFRLPRTGSYWRTPVIADIDTDGTMEIILGEDVYDHAGNVEWSTTQIGQGTFSAVADLDGDVGGEVVFVTGDKLHIHDSDGSALLSMTIPGSNPGPPAVADFDGDGAVEIALPANTSISVWEVDGTMLWSAAISDNSGLAGCSGYDVNGDGAYELLYADETTLWIYDGATGTVLFEDSNHSSQTLWEYPVVADVDRDGSAEIIVASNFGSSNGVTVFGHNGSGWAASGPTWSIHDFAVSNIEPDGTVPSPAPLPWTTHNVFRARPMVDPAGLADLYVFVEDLCVADCTDGPAMISFGVANQGGVDVPKGIAVALYARDGGVETLIDKAIIDAVPSGESIAGGTFSLHPDDWGADGMLLVVDDDGSGTGLIEECDESNNAYEHAVSICG